MKRIVAAALLLSMVGVAQADLVQEEPVMKDNTGALSGGSDAADIVSGGTGEKVKGTKEGEVTLERTETGVKVYSGLNEVETIDRGSDGWVGKMDVQEGHIYFTPAGRPQLDCPAQSLANWYGPCKVKE